MKSCVAGGHWFSVNRSSLGKSYRNGSGVLPFQFLESERAQSISITGIETFQTVGLSNEVRPGEKIKINAVREDGELLDFTVIVRLDNIIDIEYYRHGGIMQKVIRQLMKSPS